MRRTFHLLPSVREEGSITLHPRATLGTKDRLPFHHTPPASSVLPQLLTGFSPASSPSLSALRVLALRSPPKRPSPRSISRARAYVGNISTWSNFHLHYPLARPPPLQITHPTAHPTNFHLRYPLARPTPLQIRPRNIPRHTTPFRQPIPAAISALDGQVDRQSSSNLPPSPLWTNKFTASLHPTSPVHSRNPKHQSTPMLKMGNHLQISFKPTNLGSLSRARASDHEQLSLHPHRWFQTAGSVSNVRSPPASAGNSLPQSSTRRNMSENRAAGRARGAVPLSLQQSRGDGRWSHGFFLAC